MGFQKEEGTEREWTRKCQSNNTFEKLQEVAGILEFCALKANLLQQGFSLVITMPIFCVLGHPPEDPDGIPSSQAFTCTQIWPLRHLGSEAPGRRILILTLFLYLSISKQNKTRKHGKRNLHCQLSNMILADKGICLWVCPMQRDELHSGSLYLD